MTARASEILRGRFRKLAADRESDALRRAISALEGLSRIGVDAWIVGSLARGGFTHLSDVDVAVDCPLEREYEAFRTVEASMGDFPFDVLPLARFDPEVRDYLMREAVDASGLGSRTA